MFCLAAAELDRMATVYDHIAGGLGQVSELSGAYDATLGLAQGSSWESNSGEAFSSAVEHLRGEGRAVGVESGELSGEARIIAADLRNAAEQARAVARLLASAAGVAVSLLPGVVQEAVEAVGDPARFMRFLSEHGGIPSLLYTLEDIVSAESSSAD